MTTRSVCVAAVCIALAACSRPATTEFKGMVLGQKVSGAQIRDEHGMTCIPPSKVGEQIQCFGDTTIAAEKASLGATISTDGTLLALTLTVSDRPCTNVKKALRDKFGAPSATKGDVNTVEVSEWLPRDGGMIYVLDFGSSCSVDFNSATYRRMKDPPAGHPNQDL